MTLTRRSNSRCYSSDLLNEQVLDHSCLLDTRQSEVEALKTVAKTFVINPQAVQCGRVKIPDVHRILSDVVTEVIRRSV